MPGVVAFGSALVVASLMVTASSSRKCWQGSALVLAPARLLSVSLAGGCWASQSVGDVGASPLSSLTASLDRLDQWNAPAPGRWQSCSDWASLAEAAATSASAQEARALCKLRGFVRFVRLVVVVEAGSVSEEANPSIAGSASESSEHLKVPSSYFVASSSPKLLADLRVQLCCCMAPPHRLGQTRATQICQLVHAAMLRRHQVALRLCKSLRWPLSSRSRVREETLPLLRSAPGGLQDFLRNLCAAHPLLQLATRKAATSGMKRTALQTIWMPWTCSVTEQARPGPWPSYRS